MDSWTPLLVATYHFVLFLPFFSSTISCWWPNKKNFKFIFCSLNQILMVEIYIFSFYSLTFLSSQRFSPAQPNRSHPFTKEYVRDSTFFTTHLGLRFTRLYYQLWKKNFKMLGTTFFTAYMDLRFTPIYICRDTFFSPSPKCMGSWPGEPSTINL